MQRDKLIIRITRKIKKELIRWRWKKWLRSVQDYDVLEREFISVLGKSCKFEAAQVLDSEIPQDLLVIEAISLEESESIADQIVIFGTALAYSHVSKNWHRDFINNASWPVDWHWKIRKVRNDGSDVKVPWELSRCHFLLPLAIRYKKTRRENYAVKIAKTIESWMQLNPVGKGVNWTCAMDVAIRAATWLVAYEQIKSSPSISSKFRWEFYQSIYSHGKFIENNLEGPGWYAANHYLANLAGLFFIGALVPAFSNTATKWKEFAVRELESEILRQVNDDGGCFENSTSYHRLSFELFFYPYWLGGKLGHKFSKSYENRLMKMVAVVSSISKPNNQIPQIGDNDSGRFLDFGEHLLDHRYILDIGAIQFGMGGLSRNSAEISKTARILLGKVNLPSNKSNEAGTAKSKAKLVCLRDTGWHVFEIHPWWSICNLGPRNPHEQHPGHAHRDRLSFELVYRDENVFIDPGTFVYTSDPAAREQFRSSASHNILSMESINNVSQAPFYAEPLPSGRMQEFVSDEEEVRLVAALDCDGIVWTRTIVANTCKYVVIDELDKEGEAIVGNLNFHPDVMSVITDEKALTASLRLKSGAELSISFYGVASVSLEDSLYSEGYGIREMSKKITYQPNSSRSGFCIKA